MSRLYIHGHDEAEGAHRARLPAVPLPGLSAAVQRAARPPFPDRPDPTALVRRAVRWRLRDTLGVRDGAERLHLTGWPNPARQEIRRRRKECADLARGRA